MNTAQKTRCVGIIDKIIHIYLVLHKNLWDISILDDFIPGFGETLQFVSLIHSFFLYKMNNLP